MAAPHPENAAGPFYVEDGCCITCGVPLDEAPGIFGWAKDGGHCVVKRQPVTPGEITQTLTALISTEVDCIRYRGQNEEILHRMAEIGAAKQADHPTPADASFVGRDRVTFLVATASGRKPSAADIAGEFVAHLEEINRQRELFPYKIRPRRSKDAKVFFSWYEDIFHGIEFKALIFGRGFMAIAKPISPGVTQGLARCVDTWLRSTDRYGSLRWYSQKQWREGGPWRDTLV